MATEIRVPALGESVTEATVAKWLKKIGDSAVAASGKDGRLTKGDVLAQLDRGATPAAPQPVPASAKVPRLPDQREQRVRMTRLRKRIAERLKEAQNTAAMLTTFNEADMSE